MRARRSLNLARKGTALLQFMSIVVQAGTMHIVLAEQPFQWNTQCDWAALVAHFPALELINYI